MPDPTDTASFPQFTDDEVRQALYVVICRTALMAFKENTAMVEWNFHYGDNDDGSDVMIAVGFGKRARGALSSAVDLYNAVSGEERKTGGHDLEDGEIKGGSTDA